MVNLCKTQASRCGQIQSTDNISSHEKDVVCVSSQTRDANVSGQREMAERSSRTALILNNTALGFGLTAYAVAVLCFVLFTVNVL